LPRHVICSRNKNAHRIFVDVDTCLQLNRFDRIVVSRFFSRQRGSKCDGYRSVQPSAITSSSSTVEGNIPDSSHPTSKDCPASIFRDRNIATISSYLIIPPLPKIELFISMNSCRVFVTDTPSVMAGLFSGATFTSRNRKSSRPILDQKQIIASVIYTARMRFPDPQEERSRSRDEHRRDPPGR